jgi:putative FmdB family regulatory protein
LAGFVRSGDVPRRPSRPSFSQITASELTTKRMPIYEYKCTLCHERFDVEQSIKDDTLTTIPGDDHVHTVKKVFHPVGISFKGEGFYKNDSRGASKSTTPSASPTTDTSTGTSTESAPSTGSTDSSSTPSPAPTAPSSD